MIVSSFAEGGIHSFIANERRRKLIQATIGLAEYHSNTYTRDTSIKVNKELVSTFSVFGLTQIEDYSVKMPLWKEGIESLIKSETEKLDNAKNYLDKEEYFNKRELIEVEITNLTRNVTNMKQWLKDYENINFV